MNDFLQNWGALIVAAGALIWSIISFFILNNKNKKLSEKQTINDLKKMEIPIKQHKINTLRNELNNFISNNGNVCSKDEQGNYYIDEKKTDNYIRQIQIIQNDVIRFEFGDIFEKNQRAFTSELQKLYKNPPITVITYENFKRNVAKEVTTMIKILNQKENDLYK